MLLSVKGNPNYCASIVQLQNILELEGCENICGTIIHGCHVIVSKEAKEGDIGIFFPVECSLSEVMLRTNNLYSSSEMNQDSTKKGYFAKNGRVRCVKLRGHKSEGLFMPLSSLDWVKDPNNFKQLEEELVEDVDFDHIGDTLVCEKYVIPTECKKEQNQKNEKKDKKKKLNIPFFSFHIDTQQLNRNIHKINPANIISITEKIHGTSFVVSNTLCERPLNKFEKICIKLRQWATNN